MGDAEQGAPKSEDAGRWQDLPEYGIRQRLRGNMIEVEPLSAAKLEKYRAQALREQQEAFAKFPPGTHVRIRTGTRLEPAYLAGVRCRVERHTSAKARVEVPEDTGYKITQGSVVSIPPILLEPDN